MSMMFTEMNPEQEQKDRIERLLVENNELLKKIVPREKTSEEKAIEFEQKLKSEFYKELLGINKSMSEQREVQAQKFLKQQIEMCIKENSENDISISDIKCELKTAINSGVKKEGV